MISQHCELMRVATTSSTGRMAYRAMCATWRIRLIKLALVTMIAVAALPSFAASPQEGCMKLVASGKNYASYEFGDIKVIALRDGYVDMPPTRLRHASGAPFGPLPTNVPLVNDQLRLSVNAFLIIDNQQSTLIDTGASNAWHDSMGGLLDGLKEAGIDRNSISAVALTHTHEDHVNGLIAPDGTVAFPKASRIFVPKEEVSEISGRLAKLRARVVPIDGNSSVSERITTVSTAGHSPGHTAYEVKSSAGTLLVWGDIIHVPALQFGRPEITWELDDSQPDARKARMAILNQASQQNTWVAGAHLDFPGIGIVTKRGEDFEYRDIN